MIYLIVYIIGAIAACIYWIYSYFKEFGEITVGIIIQGLLIMYGSWLVFVFDFFENLDLDKVVYKPQSKYFEYGGKLYKHDTKQPENCDYCDLIGQSDESYRICQTCQSFKKKGVWKRCNK